MRKLSVSLAFIVLALVAMHGAIAEHKVTTKSETALSGGHELDHGIGKPEMCRIEDFDAQSEDSSKRQDRELLPGVVTWRQGCLGNPTNWYQIQTGRCYSRVCANGLRFHRCGTIGFCLNWSVCHRQPTLVNGNYRVYITKSGRYRRDRDGDFFVYCSNIKPPAFLADNGVFYYYNCIPS